MKKNYAILLAAVCVLASAFIISNSSADSTAAKFSQPAKVAVVNTRFIMQKTQKYTEFMEQMKKDMEQISTELKALAEQMKKDEQALETRVKGSADYLAMAQKLMEKEASFEARTEFQKNLMALKEKQWTETMYETISEKVKEVAKKNGVTLVLDGNDDLSREIPAISPKELVLTIRTRKVLYYSDTIDLTDEVLAAVDAL